MGAVVASNPEKAKKVAKATAKLVTIGEMVDELHDLREQKRKLEAAVAEIEGKYQGIEEQLVAALDAQKVDATRGKKASCSISTTITAKVIDWDAVHAYIKKTGHFHLFQRRIADTAYRELLERGNKQVPGLEPFTKRRLNLKVL
jgi:hypothetical protein